MKPPPVNRIAAASLADAIASELAAAAYTHHEEGRAAEAQALLQQARDHRVQAIRLRALAGAEHYMAIAKLR